MANTKLINFDHLQTAVTTIKGYTDTELAKKSNDGLSKDMLFIERLAMIKIAANIIVNTFDNLARIL